ncbi:MAG: hypothetical protein LQ350_002847 [Teloschistes chrysophthalmus]|nr:MAG: hypothetical protein LQ350_002847 [Niorma chrysophthalma]
MPDSPHRLAARKNQPNTGQQTTEVSFFRRNRWIIFLGLTFHSSVIVLTTMLVLIIQAATSKPPKYINRGYFIGLMLAFGACFTTTIMIYIKYSERRRQKRKPQSLGVKLAALNEPELALHPPYPVVRDDVERIHNVINSWQHGHPPDRQDLRSILGPRMQQSAIAHLAGTTNNPPHSPRSPHHPPYHHETPHSPPPATPNADAIELKPLPPSRPAPPVPTTARDLQRFLDHELQRQEAVKRRIRNWLQGVVDNSTHEGHQYPQRRDSLIPLPLLKHRTEVPRLLAVPPHRRKGSGESGKGKELKGAEGEEVGKGRRITPDPKRLREIEKEIEMYLGVPAPPMRLAYYNSESASESSQEKEVEGWSLRLDRRGEEDKASQAGSNSGRSEQEHEHEQEVEDEIEDEEADEENGIDYSKLPLPIPRPGARARAPVLSDPITVLHVGKPPTAKSPLSTTPLSSTTPLPSPPLPKTPVPSTPHLPPTPTKPPQSPTASRQLGSKPGLPPTPHPSSKKGSAQANRNSEIDDFAEKWLESIRMSVDVTMASSSASTISETDANTVIGYTHTDEDRWGSRERDRSDGYGGGDGGDGGEGGRVGKGKSKVVMRGGVSSSFGKWGEDGMGGVRYTGAWLKSLVSGARGRSI